VTATSLNPTLTWSDGNPYIFYYEIQVSRDSLFDTNPNTAVASVFINLIHGGESRPFNSWVVPASYPLEQGCKYYWRVRPRVQGNGTPVNWPLAFWFNAPARSGSASTCTEPTNTPPVTPPSVTVTPIATATPGASTRTLIITKVGNGTVTSLPVGISCGIDCSEQYNLGTVVTLIATPDAQWIFSSGSWAGDSDCSDGVVTMSTDRACTAIFTSATGAGGGPYTLIVTKAGNGSGTVTSSPPGITCGTDCSEVYTTASTTVTLTGVADSGSVFVGFSGDPDCTDYVVSMTASKTCIATFNLLVPPSPTPTPTQAVPPTPTYTPTPTFTPTPTPTPTPAAPVTAIFNPILDASSGSLLSLGAWPPGQSDIYAVQTAEGANKVAVGAGSNFTIARGFVSFDTSSIPSSATILSTTLDLFIGAGNFVSQDNTTFEVVSASQGPALAKDDWNRVGSTSFASTSVLSLQPNARNLVPLNSSGISAINKGGITQLGLRLGLDLLGQRPNGGNEINTALVSDDRIGIKLKVTYRPTTSTAAVSSAPMAEMSMFDRLGAFLRRIVFGG